MKRMFGLMPSNEVKLTKTFIDDMGLKIIVQSGEHGWTIIFADQSTEFKDEDDTVENNFNKAYNILKTKFNHLVEVEISDDYESYCDEEA